MIQGSTSKGNKVFRILKIILLAVSITVPPINGQVSNQVYVSGPTFYKIDPKGPVDIMEIGLIEGIISARFNVFGEKEEELICVMGLFDQNKLEGIVVSDVSIEANKEETIEISMPVYGELTGRRLNLYLLHKNLNPLMSPYSISEKNGKLYYVSPEGNDEAQGDYETPWESMKKAGLVEAGSLVIFEDGVYNENERTAIKSSGTAESPIILRARNYRGAKIIYAEHLSPGAKLLIDKDKDYVAIENFEMTQLGMPEHDGYNKTADILIRVRGNKAVIRGNKLYHAYEEGIKATTGDQILIEGNEIYDMWHEGIDVLNATNAIVRNNIVSEVGRVGIMVKGGARNIVVYNNIIHTKDRRIRTAAITVGGATDNVSGYDIREGTGYELYNSVFYNNIIYSEAEGMIASGISYLGARDCHSYNNIVSGAEIGIRFNNPSGISNGWEWNPINLRPVVKNNIIHNCRDYSYNFVKEPQGLVSEYNLFYQSPNPPVENGGVYQAPMFVEVGRDWRLLPQSPAVGAGTQISPIFLGYEGKIIRLELNDFSNKVRIPPWDIGAYAAQ